MAGDGYRNSPRVWFVAVLVASIAVYSGGLYLNNLQGDCPGQIVAASFDHEYRDGTLQVTHDGGDSFTPDNTGSLVLATENGTIHEFDLPFEPGDARAVTGPIAADGLELRHTPPATPLRPRCEREETVVYEFEIDRAT